jgi:toluene monooxygenase system ferredoxin subunit
MHHHVGPLAELWRGEMRAVEIAGQRVLLIHTSGGVTAVPDRCLHRGVPLSAGRLQGCVLTCAAHEWQYDACTGAGLNPDNVALRRFPVEIRAGEIWVDVDGSVKGAGGA